MRDIVIEEGAMTPLEAVAVLVSRVETLIQVLKLIDKNCDEDKTTEDYRAFLSHIEHAEKDLARLGEGGYISQTVGNLSVQLSAETKRREEAEEQLELYRSAAIAVIDVICGEQEDEAEIDAGLKVRGAGHWINTLRAVIHRSAL